MPLLAAFLMGALLATGITLGTDRLDAGYRWMTRGDDDPRADPDHDGLTTAVERAGFVTEDGDTYVSDPEVADSDDDGLTDGEEAGASVSSGSSFVYLGIADPRTADTDEDSVEDGDEYFLGTNPRSGDTDGDGLQDLEELDFGSDPLVANPDGDDYSDGEERERGSAPMAYDESGWRAKLSTGLTVLKFALSAADKLSGGGKVAAVVKAVSVARAAGVAVPMIWDALRERSWSDFDSDEVLDEVFGDDMDELGEALEGGHSDYVAYVARGPDGALAYVGITKDFDELTARHGGRNTLSLVGGSESIPLNQARAIAEAVISDANNRMDGGDLANSRHLINPAGAHYALAIRWGSEQLKLTGFEF